MSLHIPATGEPIVVTPEVAGWAYCGLRILELSPGTPQILATGDSEAFVLPLAGAVTVFVAGAAGGIETSFELAGRDSVFAAVTDFAYVGRDSVITLTSARGAEVALPSARCTARRAAAYGAASDVRVEVRGAGPATRQVTNFGTPDGWPHAEKLICCELITPPGNWSSYPPHKHDGTDPCEIVNEEIYYYRIAGADQVTPSRDGFGLHRTYTGAEHVKAGLAELDESIEVRDGDVVLIPHGYHGPCVAAPGYPMYYLNILAGPGDSRSMAFCDDPAHAWIRDSWAGLPTDPRCPVTSAGGRLDGVRA
ncbi:MAG: 5-deoxy-glucuronate isomerase [Pseudonocardiales bacterium]|nr:5-deoxy-glucuronate isomerase [Pseudonocardiales bacterium]